jgi:rubrerythrin
MLPSNVKTTRDLMTIALQAEREAIRRYSQLQQKMQQFDNLPATQLFQRMVEEEKSHETLLLQWMDKLQLDENADIPPVSWQDPNILSVYNEEARDPVYSSPYRALAFAVHNEEIAFSFYTHVAANSTDKEIREFAEVLAREELGHAALLRSERRRAYHSERQHSHTEPRLNPEIVATQGDLLQCAVFIDEYLASQLATLDTTDVTAQLNASIHQNLDDCKQQLELWHQDNTETTASLNALKNYYQALDISQKPAGYKLCRLLSNCDHAFSFYDGVVANSRDEETMLLAQKLSSLMLDRIALLKTVTDQAECVA